MDDTFYIMAGLFMLGLFIDNAVKAVKELRGEGH